MPPCCRGCGRYAGPRAGFPANWHFVLGELLQFEHRLDVLGHRQLAEDRGSCGRYETPMLRAPVDREVRDPVIVEIDLAAIRCHQADDHVKVVVLPAPFGPSRPTTSPLFTSKETSCTTVRFFVALVQIVRGQSAVLAGRHLCAEIDFLLFRHAVIVLFAVQSCSGSGVSPRITRRMVSPENPRLIRKAGLPRSIRGIYGGNTELPGPNPCACQFVAGLPPGRRHNLGETPCCFSSWQGGRCRNGRCGRKRAFLRIVRRKAGDARPDHPAGRRVVPAVPRTLRMRGELLPQLGPRCSCAAPAGAGRAGAAHPPIRPRLRRAAAGGHPTASRTRASISSAMAGLALRNSRALSLPWPIFSPL